MTDLLRNGAGTFAKMSTTVLFWLICALSAANVLVLLLAVLPTGPAAPLWGALGAGLTAQIGLMWMLQKRLATTGSTQGHEKNSDRLLASLLLDHDDGAPDNWSFELDAAGRLTSASPGFEAATGIAPDMSRNLDFVGFLENLDARPQIHLKRLKRLIETGRPFRNVDLSLDVCGEPIHWRLLGKPSLADDGRIRGFVGACLDVTAAKRADEELTRMAHFDALTGLINRGLFNFQIEHLADRLDRYGSPFGLMVLDIDGFKSINDAHGHPVGDCVLAAVAERIAGCIRETDLAARVGGDEFAVLFPTTGNREDMEIVARRVAEALRPPLEIQEQPVHVSLSGGIALAPLNGAGPEQLLRNADMAMYRAKHSDGTRINFFNAEMDAEKRELDMLADELAHALERDEFELYFQPLIDTPTGIPTAFEALVRWNHPVRGMVNPVEFIPIAEENGSIVAIGDWTIAEACRIAGSWPEHVRVSVNLSPRHLREADIVAVTRQALSRHGLTGDRLEFEISEDVLGEFDAGMLGQLSELQRLGVTIALDDFGTGMSNLSNLNRFGFDTVKIDKSFIDRIPDESAARRLLRSIAAQARLLNVSLSAEGVETREQADYLNGVACQKLQGYFFAKPLREIDLAAYLLNSTLNMDDISAAPRPTAKRA